MPACRICHHTENHQPHRFTEMMFGTGRMFDYFACGHCGCIQIATIPDDPAALYPAGYYSFKAPRRLADGRIKAFCKRLRARSRVGPQSPLAVLVGWVYRPPVYFGWLQTAGVGLADPILDVGCGSGELLVRLAKDGFTQLTGIDPHLPEDRIYPNGVRLAKQDLAQARGGYRLIMLHHCFEHMADPQAALGHLARLLAPGGRVLIRLPLADSFAWRHYGPCWVQIDAPRHFFLHTVASIKLLAGRSGFAVDKIVYDSDEFQFWGSEQVKMGIALTDPRSFASGKNPGLFPRGQLRSFKRQARRLNRSGQGDQACFYLVRSDGQTQDGESR